MNSVVCLFAMISASMACTCTEQSANDAYCHADFVAHVRVKNSFNYERNGERYTIYVVEYFRYFKKRSSESCLPNVIYTSSDVDSGCGLRMQVGEDYLLSGTYDSDGNLHVSYCGQVRDEGYEGVSDWSHVSSQLQNNMNSYQC